MLLLGLIEDEDIIQIYYHKQIGKWIQDIIHNTYEYDCRGITQVEGMTNHGPTTQRNLIYT